MRDVDADVNKRIATRVRELRSRSRLSLDGLAERSGVSRSMISVIERGESSATATLLDKLAWALGVPLASLFDSPDGLRKDRTEPLMRYADQPLWKDPASGYIRRNVSPSEALQRIRIVEVHFPPSGRVAFEPGPDERPFQQQIWLLDGVMEVHLGKAHYHLRKGDCLAVRMDQLTMFYNPGKKTARYAVVTAPERKPSTS